MRRLLAALICLLGLAPRPRRSRSTSCWPSSRSTKFDDIEAGITGLAASGSPQAAAILEALGDGKLLVQPAAAPRLHQSRRRRCSDAATGAAAPPISWRRR